MAAVTARLITARHPDEAELAAAVQTVSAFIEDPETGWRPARAARVRALLKAWTLMLEANERHGAHDAEKS